MSSEITRVAAAVEPRIFVADPVLAVEVASAAAGLRERRDGSGEFSDPDLADSLSELPGAGVQRLERFDGRRSAVDVLCRLFGDHGDARVSARLAECSPWLKAFRSGVGERWLFDLRTCKVRECPVCDSAAAAKRQRRLSAAVAMLQSAHPSMRWIFLTLTVRNCALRDLRRTVLDMNAAWRRLSERKEFRYVIGWSRAVEVTRAADNLAHPHAHILLGVSSTYFKSGYLSQARWTDLWRECARLDYVPVVDVRAVKRPSSADRSALEGAIAEVTKAASYSVKPSELRLDDGWIVELHDQQSKLRFFSAGGELKQALLAVDDVDGGDDVEACEASSDEVLAKLLFSWRQQVSQYRRSR